MRRIIYNGCFKDDIKSIFIKEKKSDIIFSSIIKGILINIPITLLTVLASSLDISKSAYFLPLVSIILTGIEAELFLINPITKIKRRKKDAIMAEKRLEHLAKDVVLEDTKIETNFMRSITSKQNLMDSIEVEIESDSLDQIVTDFYSLDLSDRLIVLREVKHCIKKRLFDKTEDESFLYQLDKDDLPEELPVVRRLEVKNNEKN
ncbi:MAG: hypothetical protein OSJ65_06135 [Bacilli bacterium]|nr:hypothetical protein [Bacilli bacterium]